MIKKLRTKFITISIIAVASVMVLLFAAVNIISFVSVNTKLNNTLDMISENQGQMPQFKRGEGAPEGEKPKPQEAHMGEDFNAETPFSTRFFVVYYAESGEKIKSDLDQIAAVDDTETDDYIAIALAHGEGYGFTESYKYRVTPQEDGSYMAVFVNDEREMSSSLTLLFVSLGATAVCIGLISILIILFSKKAMQPVIESHQKQKQFITDASHELKTPITVINTSLSVLEMEVGKQKWIDKAKAQCDKLKDLVNSLVTLSRMDEEDNPLQLKEFDISASVGETVESFADFAGSLGHPLEADIAQGITYKGDEYAVRQLTSILLENAIKYASEGTAVRFSLQKHKKGVIIRSENESENIDTAQLGKLFDRFYRADKARNSSTGGFGIGLSIARSICEAHSGSIKAESADGKVITFTAKLK